jgi:hypothetical protein
VRLVFVLEDAPEFARTLPEQEWMVEHDPDGIARAGRPISDMEAGPVTWGVWMRKNVNS